MVLLISTTKFFIAETSSGDYNSHRWICKSSDYNLLNSKQTCKPPELHTIMKKCNGTGLVLKICVKRRIMSGKDAGCQYKTV